MNITANYQTKVFNYNLNNNKMQNPSFGAKLKIEGNVPKELRDIFAAYAKNIGGDNDFIALRI